MNSNQKESLVKYDSPVLISEKTQNDKTQKKVGLKTSGKLPPVLDQSKVSTQVEEILNNIIPPRYSCTK